MPDVREFTVRFYTADVGEGGLGIDLADALEALVVSDSIHRWVVGDDTYLMKDLTSTGRGRMFSGVFGKLRMGNLPHVGDPEGHEHELDLAEREGLLEKNHFLFYRDHNLLVYQINRTGSAISTFSAYMTDYMQTATVFNPVLQPDATRRLMRGGVEVETLELSIAAPRDPRMYAGLPFSQDLIDLMRKHRGLQLKIRLSANKRGDADNHLPNAIKRSVAAFVDNGHARVARVYVDGDAEPIDLIADRLISRQTVEMSGRYPVPDSMFAALRRARDENRRQLDEIFAGAGARDG